MMSPLKISFLHKIEKDGLSPLGRLAIIMSELGALAKSLGYMTRFKNDAHIYKVDCKLHIGDLIVQCIMLCYDLGFNPKEIINLGAQHTYERFQDFEKMGWCKE